MYEGLVCMFIRFLRLGGLYNMLKKLKRNLTIMVVVCLITVVAVIAPFYSNASSVEPTATIDIEKVNKEFLEVDPATAAVDFGRTIRGNTSNRCSGARRY